MSIKGDKSDISFEWAWQKYKVDPGYWQDRAKNGNGLIRDIANFVLKQAGEAQR